MPRRHAQLAGSIFDDRVCGIAFLHSRLGASATDKCPPAELTATSEAVTQTEKTNPSR